ncbi:MAG: hypothetical protein R3Y09_08515 [Clostridia bacterium]
MKKLHTTKIACRCYRPFGDNTARASHTQKRELKEAKPPRGIGLITAEFQSSISESGLARCVEIQIKPNDIDVKLLTEWQEKAEQYFLSTSMKAYILWLENQLDTKEKRNIFTKQLKLNFEMSRKSLREDLTKQQIDFHDRTPNSVAYLVTSFDYFLSFLVEKNIIDDKEIIEQSIKMFDICIEVCKSQSENLKMVSISQKFIENILIMIENENVFVTAKENFISCQNDCIGFYDDEFLYLNMTATIKSLRKFCLEQGESMPPNTNILLKHLDEDGMLVLNSANGRTHSIKLSNGKNIRVAKLKKANFCTKEVA